MVSDNAGEERMYVLANAVQTVAWNKDLGTKLAKIKEESGLSFMKLSKETESIGEKSSDAFLVNLVSGKYSEVSFKKLVVICQVLGVDIHEFVPVISQKIFPLPLDSTNNS